MSKFLSIIAVFEFFAMCISAQSVVAYYPFNGNANDESGHNNNPIYIGEGVTLTSDRFNKPNKAYYFDGVFGPTGNTTGSFIRIPADNFPTTNRTISFWFKADAFTNGPTPISYGGNGCNSSCYIIALNRPVNNAYNVSGHCNVSNFSYPYTIPPVGLWKHWVITTEGNTQYIYINGELKQTANNYIGPTYVSGKSFIIGALIYPDGVTVYEDAGGSGSFKGSMDDIRVYDYTLTNAEVFNLHQSEYEGVVAYYPFNGNANDESIYANHGTVQNAVLTTDRFGSTNKAYSFTNPNHITVPYNEHVFRDSFTLTYWYKVEGYYGDRAALSCVAAPNGGFQQSFSGTNFIYIQGYNFSDPNQLFYSSYTIPSLPNTWQYVTLTYKKINSTSSETKLYINGELKKYDIHNMAIAFTPGATFYIGQNHDGLNFQGDLDDIKVFNYILTSGEIVTNFENDATCSDILNAKVTSSENLGAGTLRAAINCLQDGGNITFDQSGNPTTTYSDISTTLLIDKNITITGLNVSNRPLINLDFLNINSVITLQSGKTLELINVDLKAINHSGSKTYFEGSGSIKINGFTSFLKQ